MHGTFPRRDWEPPRQVSMARFVAGIAVVALVGAALLGLVVWAVLAVAQLALGLESGWALTWTLLSAIVWVPLVVWWVSLTALHVASEEEDIRHQH